MDREEVARIAREVGLGDVAGRYAALAKPSIRLTLIDPPVEPLASRLGGSPALPAAFAWPRWKDEYLAFMGQLRLADLPPTARELDLPPDGLLSFFYAAEEQPWGFEPGDAGSARVYWFAAGTELSVVVPSRVTSFTERAVAFSEEWTLPDWTALELEPGYDGPGAGPPLESDDTLFDRLELLERRLQPDRGPRHRVGGHPDVIQNEMRVECEVASHGFYHGDAAWQSQPFAEGIERRALEWELLLQVDSDRTLGTVFGDAGTIYYWIRRDDLRARDFDRPWLVLQCS